MQRWVVLFFLFWSQLAFCMGTGKELQELIDSSCQSDGFVRLEKDYSINETIYIKCSMDAQDKTVYVEDGSIDALEVRGLINAKVVLPNVINVSPDPGNGQWTPSGHGVKLVNIDSTHVEVGHVRNFDYGVALIGNKKGAAFNSIYIRHLENNRVNLILQPWNKGWVNQNNFYGGRYSHWSNEGVALDGVTQVTLATDYVSDANGPPNNNTWYGASFEGAASKYAVDITGDYNVFYNSRWEDVNGVLFREGSRDNVIHYGYGARRLLRENRVFGDLLKNKIITAY